MSFSEERIFILEVIVYKLLFRRRIDRRYFSETCVLLVKKKKTKPKVDFFLCHSIFLYASPCSL